MLRAIGTPHQLNNSAHVVHVHHHGQHLQESMSTEIHSCPLLHVKGSPLAGFQQLLPRTTGSRTISSAEQLSMHKKVCHYLRCHKSTFLTIKSSLSSRNPHQPLPPTLPMNLGLASYRVDKSVFTRDIKGLLGGSCFHCGGAWVSLWSENQHNINSPL